MNKVLVFILVFCSSLSVFAQSVFKDLEEINRHYAHLESFQVKMRMQVYIDNVLQDNQEMNFNKQGKHFFNQANGIDMLLNDHYTIMINNKSKSILINKVELDSLLFTDQLLNFNVKSLIDSNKVESKIVNGITIHKMYLPIGQPMESVEITVNMETKTLIKLVYDYRSNIYQEQKVVIDVLETNVNPNYEENFFDEKRIFKKNGEGYISLGQYKDYEIQFVN